MRSRSCLSLFAALALLTSSASAQIRPGQVTLRMLARSGTVGDHCSGFSCTPHRATVARGETVLLETRGRKDGLYVLLISAKASNCVRIPPIYQSLILGLPVPLIVAGRMSKQDFIRACPGGIGELKLPIPRALAPRSTFALQAVAETFGVGKPPLGFTSAIVGSVL